MCNDLIMYFLLINTDSRVNDGEHTSWAGQEGGECVQPRLHRWSTCRSKYRIGLDGKHLYVFVQHST